MRRLLPLLVVLVGCKSEFADPDRAFGPSVDDAPAQPTEIHKPPVDGVWHSPLIDDPTVPEQAKCLTCHGPNPENFATQTGDERFHTNIELVHDHLTCDHCHDQDRTKLHLADGTKLPFSEVMQLCAQCHGPTFRDYSHGAHGGMNGYWDVRQGTRVRNNCVDCHTPHAPLLPQVTPAPPPNDRFLEAE